MPALQKVLIVLLVILFVAIVAAVLLNLPEPEFEPEEDIIEHIPSEESTLDTVPDWNPDELPDYVPEPIEGPQDINPLTGLLISEDSIRNRPLAIALNNIPEALPMNGVSYADIIYEIPVEGGLTRMIALFQDPTRVKLIGSIRSARHYTVQLANSYDAILVAAGRSPLAQDEVRALKIPFLNEVEGPLRDIFYRDRSRIPGRRVESLHSVVTTGERIEQWLPTYDFRLVHEQDYKHTLFFVEDGTPRGGSNANEVSVRMSSGKTTSFSYNKDDKAYYMRQYNRDFVDANNNVRPAFTNILILKTSVTPIRGDASGRLNVETTGSGDGYFVCGGKYIKINWARADKSFPFIYTHEDGSLLELGAGRTFICITPTNLDATFN